MKYTFALLLTCLVLPAVYAQQKTGAATLENAVDAMAEQYKLDAAQREAAVEIQERRLRNLADIATLESTDYKRYLEKKNYIRQATQASLRRILTEEQMPILKEQMLERRKRESKLIERLKAEGASQEDIQIAIWELE